MEILIIIAMIGMSYFLYKACTFDADTRIEQFLKQYNIAYKKDYTNKDIKYIKIQSGLNIILLKFNDNGEFLGISVIQNIQ